MLKCINEECGKVAPRDKTWRKSRVIVGSDICKECFEIEVEALGLAPSEEEEEEKEEGEEREGMKKETAANNGGVVATKIEGSESVIHRIFAAIAAEQATNQAAQNGSEGVTPVSRACQKCRVELPPQPVEAAQKTTTTMTTSNPSDRHVGDDSLHNQVAEVLSLCRNCYREEIAKLQMKSCAACMTNETAGGWYRSHVKKGMHLCHRCYYRERATLSTKVCAACNSDRTSGSWLKSKTVSGGYLCVNCYYKELVALSGKHCGTCESKTTSSIWYNDKVRAGKYLCAKCYARERKKIKDKKKLEAEEANKKEEQKERQEQK